MKTPSYQKWILILMSLLTVVAFIIIKNL